ncbi:hypothetical protein SVIOM74S_01681 [Streptomyces violarus]
MPLCTTYDSSKPGTRVRRKRSISASWRRAVYSARVRSHTLVPSTLFTRVLLTLTSRGCGVAKNRMSSRGSRRSPSARASSTRSHRPCTPRHWSGCSRTYSAKSGRAKSATRNISVIGCTSPSSGRPISYGAPQAAATSPSPVPSTTTSASITTGPDLVSNTTRQPSSRRSAVEAKAWNSIRTPASSIISSRTSLKSSGSKGTVYPVLGEGFRQPPRPMSRSSSRHSTPWTTGSPSPWSVGSSRASSPDSVNVACLCSLWKDISGMTRAAVALPPRNP